MPDFVCMADHSFVKWLELCVPAIRRTHPDARVLVFDLTPELSPAVLEFCRRTEGTVHLPFGKEQWRWPRWIDGTDFGFYWPRFTARETVKYWLRRIRIAVTGKTKDAWMTDKGRHAEKMKRFCRIVSQKPAVLAAALERTDRDIVFVDADAIVLKSLAPVFERGFDFAATTEEPGDVVIGPDPAECTERPSYPIRAVNTGMIFLRNNAAARQLLADWAVEMEEVRHVSAEQTALASLLLKNLPGFFSSRDEVRTMTSSKGVTVRVLGLPMSRYNCTKIRADALRVSEEVFVVHFVGSLKQAQHWDAVRALIGRITGAAAPGLGAVADRP
jgi:Nucleotide-diphospho-sugar transferase